ncbi:MAG: hypothetical protein IPG04_18315 [Polyangiaceae bacterium]|nr:hypothetical protein [Polyangiaceae bacterium]
MERGEVVDGCFWIDRCVKRSAALDLYRAVDVRDSSSVWLRVHSGLSSAGSDHFLRTCSALSAHPSPALERVVAWGALGEASVYAAVTAPSGPTLEEALEHGLMATDALPIAIRALQALSLLHALGVPHGAVDARALVLPLGAATAATLVDVTLVPRALIAVDDSLPSVRTEGASLLAPERIRERRGQSAPADVFALGCVLYQALTGRLPFAAAGVLGTFLRVLHEEPEPPRPDEADELNVLADLTLRMLAKSPSVRPTAEEALAELEVATGSEPFAAPITSPPSVTSATRRLRAVDVGLVLCREVERGHASLARESELDRIERALEGLAARLDRLSDGTLLVEIATGGPRERDPVVGAARAALLLQTTLPASRIVVARGGARARGLEVAERYLERAPVGAITVLADVVGVLEPHFDIDQAAHGAVLYEREPRTRERAEESARRRAPKPGIDLFARPFVDLDSEVTIVEHKRRTIEIEMPAVTLEAQPTLEMDMTALARAMLEPPAPAPLAGAPRDDADTHPPLSEDGVETVARRAPGR